MILLFHLTRVVMSFVKNILSILFLFLVQKKKLVVEMWVKSEIFCLALQILKNQDTSVSKKTIIRFLSIKM